jgi:hypothetical protein
LPAAPHVAPTVNHAAVPMPQLSKNLSVANHRAHSRLLRECEAFRVELGFLERRSARADNFWAIAVHEQLNNVLRCLESDDIEGGWFGVHAAQRYAVFGMNQIELTNRAHVLREESLKINSWRAVAMEGLLSGSGERLTAENVADAIALRNEDFSHRRFKAGVIGDRLRVLLLICGVAAVGAAPFMLLSGRIPMVAAVIFLACSDLPFVPRNRSSPQGMSPLYPIYSSHSLRSYLAPWPVWADTPFMNTCLPSHSTPVSAISVRLWRWHFCSDVWDSACSRIYQVDTRERLQLHNLFY